MKAIILFNKHNGFLTSNKELFLEAEQALYRFFIISTVIIIITIKSLI